MGAVIPQNIEMIRNVVLFAFWLYIEIDDQRKLWAAAVKGWLDDPVLSAIERLATDTLSGESTGNLSPPHPGTPATSSLQTAVGGCLLTSIHPFLFPQYRKPAFIRLS